MKRFPIVRVGMSQIIFSRTEKGFWSILNRKVWMNEQWGVNGFLFKMKYSKTDLSLFSPTVAKYRMCVSFHIFVGGEGAKDDAQSLYAVVSISRYLQWNSTKYIFAHHRLTSSALGWKYLWGYKIFSFPKNNSDHQSKH